MNLQAFEIMRIFGSVDGSGRGRIETCATVAEVLWQSVKHEMPPGAMKNLCAPGE